MIDDPDGDEEDEDDDEDGELAQVLAELKGMAAQVEELVTQ